jgi:hypothetical protein
VNVIIGKMNLSELIDLLEHLEYDIQKETENEGKPVDILIMNATGAPVKILVARNPETKKVERIIFK